MDARHPTRHDPTAFREVISQWQLAARTEVKKASSLPSKMFDTCDPMLEARLTESVEAMMNCLHEPGRELDNGDAATREVRTETVSADEMRALPRLLSDASRDFDLEAGTTAEFLSLLADTCATGEPAAREASRALLHRVFDIHGESDLDDATRRLHACVNEVLGDAASDKLSTEELAMLCQRIAAVIVVTPTDEQTT